MTRAFEKYANYRPISYAPFSECVNIMIIQSLVLYLSVFRDSLDSNKSI